VKAQNAFKEWVLDVTCYGSNGSIAFVPLVGDDIVFGLTCIRDRAPGPLVGVVSENGLEHAQRWVDEHPNWRIDYCSPELLTDA
jgi:hypothetical protein